MTASIWAPPLPAGAGQAQQQEGRHNDEHFPAATVV